jgi:phosphoribosylaminoimidazole-succinocarboxamide synthase
MIPGLQPSYSGKVRDVYDLGDRLLIVATDRISAFDVIFREPIPEKGRILSTLSWWWFRDQGEIGNVLPNHAISNDPVDFPEPFRAHADLLRGRSMLVKKAKRIDFECVVRGYIAGSAWKEYKSHGTVNSEPVASGLVESGRFPSPIFTPATKAAEGHDENIPFSRMEQELGAVLARKLRDLSIQLYETAAAHAASRGLILADTKFEFGLNESGHVILIDEALTPDSSRYWFESEYAPGKTQNPFDKQFVRDYLETLDWNKQPPPPPLPAHVIQGTADRYRESFRRITGKEFT